MATKRVKHRKITMKNHGDLVKQISLDILMDNGSESD